MKRISEALPDYAPITKVEEIQNRLLYFSTEEFTMQSCGAVKEFAMNEIKKALKMIMSVENTM